MKESLSGPLYPSNMYLPINRLNILMKYFLNNYFSIFFQLKKILFESSLHGMDNSFLYR